MDNVTAKLNYLKIAPRKVRLIANTLKGLSVQEAEAQLLLRAQRSAPALLKLLRSAVANAKNRKLDPTKLFVASILVNQGPMLKRFLPRAMGRATPLQKKMSHVTLVLGESAAAFNNRFNIVVPKKDKKKKEAVKKAKPKAEVSRPPEVKERAGFFKKLFTRKTGQ